MALLRERLPADAILTNGAGNFSVWTHRFYEFRQYPTQLAPTSGAMGYGVPAAVTAKLLHPDRIVVAMAGDGDFLMTRPGARDRGPVRGAIVVLVVNNGMFGTIRMHQERHYPGRVSGTDLVNPDFAALAQAFGAHGVAVERTEDFGDAFEAALASGRPAVIELRVDPEALTPRQSLSEIRAAGAREGGSRCVVSIALPVRRSRSRTSPTPSRRTASSSSPASSPSTGRRELVGGDDVVAQARCVFENMRAVLAAAGCTFADVVKVTVFLTDVNDRPLDQPGAAGGASATRVRPRRSSRSRRS